MCPTRKRLTTGQYLPEGISTSSTLTKLKINVSTFADFLYLLDGRLDCLSTLIIYVSEIFESAMDIRRAVSIKFLFVLFSKNNA